MRYEPVDMQIEAMEREKVKSTMLQVLKEKKEIDVKEWFINTIEKLGGDNKAEELVKKHFNDAFNELVREGKVIDAMGNKVKYVEVEETEEIEGTTVKEIDNVEVEEFVEEVGMVRPAIITRILKGKVRDLIYTIFRDKAEKVLQKWLGDLEREAIALFADVYYDNTFQRKIRENVFIGIINLPKNGILTRTNSKLYQFKMVYGSYPRKGLKVRVTWTGKGYRLVISK